MCMYLHIKHNSSFLKGIDFTGENSSNFPFKEFVNCQDVYFRLQAPNLDKRNTELH